MNHWAIPCNIWNAMQEEKESENKQQHNRTKKQQQLDFQAITGPCEFTREGALHTVAKLIATNNQVYVSRLSSTEWISNIPIAPCTR